MRSDEPDIDRLHEMAFAWLDIEREFELRSPDLADALAYAYRVEADIDENHFHDPFTAYVFYFNVQDERSRAAARRVRESEGVVAAVIRSKVDLWDRRYSHIVRVVPPGREGDGVLCERRRSNAHNAAIAPLDTEVTAGAQHLDSQSVSAAWTKALARRNSDPEGAVTAARSLLESTFKTVLDDRGIEYQDRDDLPTLYKAVQGALRLAPSAHTEDQFRRILGACTTVVKELGSLRNRMSDSHGPGRKSYRPAARHAALAVNLAGSMALFLMETHEANDDPALTGQADIAG